MLAPAPHEHPPVFAAVARPNGLVRLAVLHAEAGELFRLSAFPQRALVIAGLLAAGSVLAAYLFFAPVTLVWLVLSLAGAGALLAACRRTRKAPFDRGHLQSFLEEMRAMLLYAGVIWGTGGWFVLPATAPVFTILVFAALPVGAIAALGRDRDLALLFGVPVATLVSFASVLRPFSDAGLDAGLILIACGLSGAAMLAALRRTRPVITLPSLNEINA
jgi:hypothetical protein